MMKPYKRSERDRIDRMVRTAAFALKPDLVFLRYDFIEDHTGEDAIAFKMVITNEIATDLSESCRTKSSPVCSGFRRIQHLETAIRAIVEPEEYGLLSYFNVRSESEWRKTDDPAWREHVSA